MPFGQHRSHLRLNKSELKRACAKTRFLKCFYAKVNTTWSSRPQAGSKWCTSRLSFDRNWNQRFEFLRGEKSVWIKHTLNYGQWLLAVCLFVDWPKFEFDRLASHKERMASRCQQQSWFANQSKSPIRLAKLATLVQNGAKYHFSCATAEKVNFLQQ